MSEQLPIPQLLEKAWTCRRKANYQEALQLSQQAEQLCNIKDYNFLGRIYHIYMQIDFDFERFESALKHSKQALSYYQQANNPDKVAHSTRHLADLQVTLKHYQKAEENYQKAISIYRQSTHTFAGDFANVLRAFALCLEKLGKSNQAISTWEEVKSLYQTVELQAGVDEANQHLSYLK